MSESGSSSIQAKTTNPDTPNDNKDQQLNSSLEEWSQQTFDLSQLSELVKEVASNDRLLQHHGTIGIRKLVSSSFLCLFHSHFYLEEPSPIQEVVDTGIVPRLIEFMQNDKETHLQVIEF